MNQIFGTERTICFMLVLVIIYMTVGIQDLFRGLLCVHVLRICPLSLDLTVQKSKQQNYSRSHYLMKTLRQLFLILRLTSMPAQPRQIMTYKVSMSAFSMRAV